MSHREGTLQRRGAIRPGLGWWILGGVLAISAPVVVRRKIRPRVRPRREVVHLRFDNGEGIALAADLYASGHEDVVIVAHGFTSSKNAPEIVETCEHLARDYDVLALDLRGHGESGGRYDLGLDPVARDVAAAVRLARALRYRRVALMGFSLGAAACVMCAAEAGGADAVISVACPAAPLSDSRWARFSVPLWRGWARLMGTRVSTGGTWSRFPADVVGQVSAPILIVHDGDDALIPKEISEAFFAAAREPKDYLFLPNTPHAQVSREALNGIVGWLGQHLPQPAPRT